MPNEFGKFIEIGDFDELPNDTELTNQWSLIEKDFGPNIGGPNNLNALPSVQKWQIICLYRLRQETRRKSVEEEENGGGGFLGNMLQDDDELSHYSFSPTRWLDRLRDQNAGQLSLELAGDLKLQLRASSGAWLAEFFRLGGLRALVERLADIASMDERDDRELLLQSELLKCLKAATNHKFGIDEMTSDPALVPALALNLSSEDLYVSTQVLELLAVIMVDGFDGHRAILDAMDYFKLVRGERVRFQGLVQVLWDEEADLSFKRDVLLFLNTIINSSLEVEERIETRADMVYAGLLDCFEKLKTAGEDEEDEDDLMDDEQYEVEMQIQLFETVMHSDNSDALYAITKGPGGSSTELVLAEPTQLFDALQSTTTEFDCGPLFLSTLQHLLLIPTYDKLGKKMWEQVEASIHDTVVPPEEKEFDLGLDNVRRMLGWKERLEELSQEAAEASSSKHNLQAKVTRIESTLDEHKLASESERKMFEVKLQESLDDMRKKHALEIEQLKQTGNISQNVEASSSSSLTTPSVPDSSSLLQDMQGNVHTELASLRKEVEDLRRKLAIATASGASIEPAAIVLLKDDPKLGKYFKMLSMHLPRPAVEMKMAADGVDPKILDMDPEGPSPNQPTTPAGTTTAAPVPVLLVKDDPKFAKYFKMLSMHLPRPAVEMKMKADGLDPKILDMNPDGPSPNQAKSEASKAPLILLKDDPKYAKYFKMLSMHLPRPAVEMKMKADGLDPKVLDMKMDDPSPGQNDSDSSSNASSGGSTKKNGEKGGNDPAIVLLKDDPKFAKYFKMLAMHLPKAAVVEKIKAEGVDHTVLELDPNQPTTSRGPAVRTGGGFAIPPPPAKYPKKLSEAPPVPMRALFWQRIVADELDNTVWAKLSDANVELDVDLLLDSFAKEKKKNEEEMKKLAEKEAADARRSSLTKQKATNLLDPKVLQNVGIALAKFRLPAQDIKSAILGLDEQVLSFDMVKSLHNLRPTSEDKSTLSDFEGDVATLGKVEQFFLLIMEIPRYDERLESMLFKLRFDKEADELKRSLNTVKIATEEVINSKKLTRILEVVLRLGNFLNGGSTRGGIYGFRLDALLKLATIKSVDNKRNLMNYLAEWCAKHEPSLLTVSDDLEVAGTVAMRHPLTAWSANFKTMQGKIKMVKLQIEATENDPKQISGDKFIDGMTSFQETAEDLSKKMEKEYSVVEKKFFAMLSKFGEDPGTCGCSEFFGELIAEFLALFQKAHFQNEKRRQLEEKAKAKAEAAAKKAAAKLARMKARQEAGVMAEKMLGQSSGKPRRNSLSRRGSIGNRDLDDDDRESLADNIFTRMRNMQSNGTSAAPAVPATREGAKACVVKDSSSTSSSNKNSLTRGTSSSKKGQADSQLEAMMGKLGGTARRTSGATTTSSTSSRTLKHTGSQSPKKSSQSQLATPQGELSQFLNTSPARPKSSKRSGKF